MPTAAFRGKTGAGEYGDFTHQVDDAVGRVLKALDDNGLTDNTLVIFTSDNGAYWVQEEIEEYNHLSNHYWRGQKADIWEGGHRVPFVARWPGKIPAGAVSDELTCHTDLLATCAAIVGAELPADAGEDSFDMLPAFLGQKGAAPIREAVVHSSAAGYFAIRAGDWKLVTSRGSGGFSEPKRVEVGPGDAKGQLYRLDSDPSESRNLYLDQPERVREMEALLERYKSAGRSRP
jgi:arylsulfatase A-like enzyme